MTAAQSMANTLVDPTTLASFAGLSVVTMAAVNGVRMAFRVSPRWLGLIVSLGFCLVLAHDSGGAGPTKYAVAIGNAFIVYVSAFGAAQTAAAAAERPGRGGGATAAVALAARPSGARRFFRPW